MRKAAIVVVLIVIVSLALVAYLVYVRRILKPEVAKWPSGDNFPREPTLQDLIPTLPLDSQNEKEDWWYGAILNGSDGKTYGLIFGGAQIWFGEITPEGIQPTEIITDTTGFSYQVGSRNISLTFSGAKGRIDTTITPHQTYLMSNLVADVFGKYKLDLDFKSRGLPYWYGNGNGASVDGWIVNGLEDLSTANGVLQSGGNTVNLSGQGVFERARWGYPIGLTASNWYPMNFKQGYALVFQGKGEEGSIYKDAIVSIQNQYDYVGDKSKINVELLDLDAEKVPHRVHITVQESFGELDLLGTFIGHMQAGIIRPAYSFTGTFTYNNGTVLPLTDGNGFDAYRPW